MSTSVLPHRLRSPAPLWQRLIAALAPVRGQAGREEWGVNSELVHDIAVRREHQDYATCARSTNASRQRLHVRAEWFAAGPLDYTGRLRPE